MARTWLTSILESFDPPNWIAFNFFLTSPQKHWSGTLLMQMEKGADNWVWSGQTELGLEATYEDFKHKNIILKKSSSFQLVITWNSMWKLIPQHSKFPPNTQFSFKFSLCTIISVYWAPNKQPWARNSIVTTDSWNNFWKMNFVVIHSVLEEKFSPSGCKLSML